MTSLADRVAAATPTPFRPLAVAAGVGCGLLVELLVFALFGTVTVAGGLCGSALAGWLAGADGPNRRPTGGDDRRALAAGAAHGLLVALLVAVLVVPVALSLSLATGETRLLPFGLVVPRLGGPTAIALVVGLGVTLPNALVGAAAGWLGSR